MAVYEGSFDGEVSLGQSYGGGPFKGHPYTTATGITICYNTKRWLSMSGIKRIDF